MASTEGKKLTTTDGSEIGYNYAFSSDLGSGRIIQVTGVFKTGVTKKEMDVEFDKIRAALDRQLAKSALYGIEDELQKIESTIKSLTESLGEAEERFKGKNIPTNEQAAHNNIKVSLRDLAQKQGNVTKFLEKTRKEAE